MVAGISPGFGEDVPDAIATAWEEVDHCWEDEAAHRRFVALCAALNRLADALRTLTLLSLVVSLSMILVVLWLFLRFD